MKPTRPRKLLVCALTACVAFAAGFSATVLGACGPFTDVAEDGFCQFVLEIFALGITTGTTPTTYDPSGNVTRLQMAAFLSRSVDGVLKRGNRRAAVNQFWTTQGAPALGITTISPGISAFDLRFDGADVWSSNDGSSSVSRVRASDGKFLETWTGATGARCLVVAMSRVFVAGNGTPSSLYRITPSQPAGAVSVVSSALGNFATGLAFDGGRFWTANFGTSVSIVTPGPTIPWTTTNVSAGFSQPLGIVYDGANMWVTDYNFGTLLKLDSSGAILQTVTVGTHPRFPAFDGTNIWVPNADDATVSVVRASSGAVLATLTGNGMFNPLTLAFDGQRMLGSNPSTDTVSLWKAADLTPLGSFPMPSSSTPRGICSDATNFWVALTDGIARF